MKHVGLVFFALFAGIMSGCATPIVLDNGAQRTIFTPCTNDAFCRQNSYDIAWSASCVGCCYGDIHGYPVTYRTKRSEFESRFAEYVFAPKVVVYK